MEVTQMLIDFAWYSLTIQQQDRIKEKYELQIALDERLPTECKRDIYRRLAIKHNSTMLNFEKIAKGLNKL